MGKILTDINPEQSIGADGQHAMPEKPLTIFIKNDYGNTQIAVSFDGEIKSISLIP